MIYGEAMQGLRRRGDRTVTRDGAGFELAWRFGRVVMLAAEGRGFIDYTPTAEDMKAGDWRVHETAAS